jgi:hypothetical protein
MGGQQHNWAAWPRRLTRSIAQETGWVWRTENLFHPPGFEPRIIHPLTSPYVGYAIPLLSKEYGSELYINSKTVLSNTNQTLLL